MITVVVALLVTCIAMKIGMGVYLWCNRFQPAVKRLRLSLVLMASTRVSDPYLHCSHSPHLAACYLASLLACCPDGPANAPLLAVMGAIVVDVGVVFVPGHPDNVQCILSEVYPFFAFGCFIIPLLVRQVQTWLLFRATHIRRRASLSMSGELHEKVCEYVWHSAAGRAGIMIAINFVILLGIGVGMQSDFGPFLVTRAYAIRFSPKPRPQGEVKPTIADFEVPITDMSCGHPPAIYAVGGTILSVAIIGLVVAACAYPSLLLH